MTTYPFTPKTKKLTFSIWREPQQSNWFRSLQWVVEAPVKSLCEHVTKTNSNAQVVILLVLAMLIISQQSIAVKWLGGSYLVLEWLSMDNCAWWYSYPVNFSCCLIGLRQGRS